MTYVVLARKWRPQTFDEVVGQEHVRQTLTNAITLDRVHHAFLFSGARGVGKTSIARILAKSLNCESGPTITPCGSCTSCREIAAGTAMDVFEIDGASNRGINEIRELRESVRYRPSRDRYKVYIIDEVHMLTTEAFNALLKTLEEPPGHVVFIFATTEPERVPVTIQSRCQRFDFKRVPLEQVCTHLRGILVSEAITIEDDALFMIARESEGSVRDALSLLDQVIAFAGTTISAEQVTGILGITDHQALFEILEALVAGDVSRTLELCKGLFDYGIGTKELANQLLDAMRDLLVVKTCKSSRTLVDLTSSEWERFRQLSTTVETGRLERMFGLLLEGCSEIARSPFARMLLELALVRACQVPPVQTVHEILEQLTTLEARLSGGTAGGGPAGGSGSGSGGGGRASAGGSTSDGGSRNQTRLLAPERTESLQVTQTSNASSERSASSAAPAERRSSGPAPQIGKPAESRTSQPAPQVAKTAEPRASGSAGAPEPAAQAAERRTDGRVNGSSRGAQKSESFPPPGSQRASSFDWEQFVSVAKDESRLLGSILEHAQFVEFADRTLTLAPDEGFQTLLYDANYRRQIEEALVRFAGPGSRLALAEGPDPEARSLARIAEDQRREELAAKRKQIETNPLVQGGVQAVFPDAQLIAIRATLQEDP